MGDSEARNTVDMMVMLMIFSICTQESHIDASCGGTGFEPGRCEPFDEHFPTKT